MQVQPQVEKYGQLIGSFAIDGPAGDTLANSEGGSHSLSREIDARLGRAVGEQI